MRLAVAVDLEEAGPERVVDRASPWAERLGGTLDVLTVVRPPVLPSPLPGAGALDPQVQRVMDAELEQLRRRDAARLAELVARIPEAHRGIARRLEGAPVPALVAAGDGYDALLVATHGRSGLSHFWLGSIAERVVREARCVVIVLRMEPVA